MTDAQGAKVYIVTSQERGEHTTEGVFATHKDAEKAIKWYKEHDREGSSRNYHILNRIVGRLYAHD